MSEFEFLRQAFETLRVAQKLDEFEKKRNPDCVNKPVSCLVENVIKNYLELEKTK